MEPFLINPISQELEYLALEIIRQSVKLGAMLHPKTREGVIENVTLVRIH